MITFLVITFLMLFRERWIIPDIVPDYYSVNGLLLRTVAYIEMILETLTLIYLVIN